jgi:hypothetical protein
MDAFVNPYSVSLAIILFTISCLAIFDGFSPRMLGEICGFCLARLVIRAVRGPPAGDDFWSMFLASGLVNPEVTTGIWNAVSQVTSTVATESPATCGGSISPQQPPALPPIEEIEEGEEIEDSQESEETAETEETAATEETEDQQFQAQAEALGGSLTPAAASIFQITGQRTMHVVFGDQGQIFGADLIVLRFHYGSDEKLRPY